MNHSREPQTSASNSSPSVDKKGFPAESSRDREPPEVLAAETSPPAHPSEEAWTTAADSFHPFDDEDTDSERTLVLDQNLFVQKLQANLDAHPQSGEIAPESLAEAEESQTPHLWPEDESPEDSATSDEALSDGESFTGLLPPETVGSGSRPGPAPVSSRSPAPGEAPGFGSWVERGVTTASSGRRTAPDGSGTQHKENKGLTENHFQNEDGDSELGVDKGDHETPPLWEDDGDEPTGAFQRDAEWHEALGGRALQESGSAALPTGYTVQASPESKPPQNPVTKIEDTAGTYGKREELSLPPPLPSRSGAQPEEAPSSPAVRSKEEEDLLESDDQTLVAAIPALEADTAGSSPTREKEFLSKEKSESFEGLLERRLSEAESKLSSRLGSWSISGLREPDPSQSADLELIAYRLFELTQAIQELQAEVRDLRQEMSG